MPGLGSSRDKRLEVSKQSHFRGAVRASGPGISAEKSVLSRGARTYPGDDAPVGALGRRIPQHSDLITPQLAGLPGLGHWLPQTKAP